MFVVNRFLLWRLETETPAREGACSVELLDYTYVTLERGAPSGNSFPVQQRAGSTTRLRMLPAVGTDDLLWANSTTRAAGADAEPLLSRVDVRRPAEARGDGALDAEPARGPLHLA